MSDIQCANCGKIVSARFTLCPYCREELTSRTVFRQRPPGGAEVGARWIRRGLLYMLLAGISYYLLGGHSPLPLAIPFEIPDWVINYALPFLFLGGLGLAVVGFIRHSIA
ncbi:MAG TPA: hypothetical protein VNN18_04655 [Candidatus Xenobia bacterium]|nr:hypothetical protein [Candidatus Xenobia bacterium]